MRQRVQDLVRVGDALFSKRAPILSLWQTIAENFHVMRADFTRARYFSEEFGSYLMTGRPARCHRDLSDAFSSMLRRDQWFHAKTDSETVNEERDAKMWLDWASKTQRLAMYDSRAGFVRATKVADKDFVAFGNDIVTREVCDYSHLLYRSWHLRDVAWDENVKGKIDEVHFDWKPQARQLQQKFGANASGKLRHGSLGISPKVAELKNEEMFREIKCRRILLPADQYDLPASATRGMPFVSIYVDVENQHVMEEMPLRTWPVNIRRWEFGGSLFGNQYGYSPAVVYGLPDARMLQQMMLSMLEASEKATNPPLITVGEAINGGINIYAGGNTSVDPDYDERTGEVLRPLELNFDGIRYGAEQMDRLEASLDDAFYLSKIRFPEITKEMTAYEASKLWDEFIRNSLPLFEPVNDEGKDLVDGTFQDLLHLGAFGPVEDMPQSLRGRDIDWQFDTPITVAAERALTSAFQAMVGTIAQGAEIDPSIAMLPDMHTAARDAIGGGGAPAKWLRSTDQVKKLKAADDERQAQEAQAAQLAQATELAARVAGAAEGAGNAAQSLRAGGVA